MSHVIDLESRKRESRGTLYLKNAMLFSVLLSGIFTILWLFTEEDKTNVIIQNERTTSD